MARKVSWLFWCAMMGTLYLFENNTATRILLVVSILVPIASALFVPMAARNMALKVNAPQQTTKQADFSVVCRVDSPIPLVAFHMKLRCRNLLTGEEIETVSAMPSRGIMRAELICLLHTAHCGMLTIDGTVTVKDCFGIFGYRSMAMTPVYTWAMPTLRSLELVLTDHDGNWGEAPYAKPRAGMDASEPFSIREYIPGDPVRQIHWKLSQKTETVMMRELTQPFTDQVLLIFDASYPLDAGHFFPAVLSAMAEAFLSLSQSLVERGIPHTACWHPLKLPTPEYRRVASGEDWSALQTAFFSDTPLRNAPTIPDEFSEYFPHVVLIGSGHPNNEAIRDFGQHVTIFSGEGIQMSDQIFL